MAAKKESKSTRQEIEITMGIGEQILTNRHLEKLMEKELPGHTMYWLHRIINKIRSEMKEAGYFEQKQQIVEKYSIKKTDDGQSQIDPAKIGDLQKELNQYQDDPLKLPGIYQLQIDPADEEVKRARLNGHDWGILMHLCEEIQQ